MKRESKYPTVHLEQGQYYVYVHTVTTEQGQKLYYVGMSQMQPARRWNPSSYKDMSLGPYIEQYGWDNIGHQVLEIVNDKRSAETLEDILIHSLSVNGMVINERRSGGHARDNDDVHKARQREYQREYKQSEQGRAVHLKANAKYRQSEHGMVVRAKYDKSEQGKAARRKAQAKYRATTERKIYERIRNYNKTHDPVETPLEAKTKYLETGYIPTYIKHDDLI